MKTIDQSAIRKQNMRKILAQLIRHPQMTRQALTEATGVSLMTVTNLIDVLREQQVLAFSPVQRDGRKCYGRKAENISLRGDGHAWLILDLSGRRFRYTLMGFDLTVVRTGASEEAAGGYVESLYAFLRRVRGELDAALDGRALLGVGVVTPGPYEIARDRITNQRLPELSALRIKQTLTEQLGPFEYYVDEDVKFAVRAFDALTQQNTCELLYYLYIGEGVGGAAVHNGNLLRGLNATAGDAGQLLGPHGIYENDLSQQAFAARLGLCGDTGRDVQATDIAQVAAQSPERYRQALCQSAQSAADMLHGVLWLLDPTHIVIDCRYAGPFGEMYIEQVCEALRRQSGGDRQLPCIVAAPQEMSSVLRGAIIVLQREWIEHIVS